uniref:Peptidase M13 C-terminal domain-containing protein n=1 Tax=Plectus sambesii TaxID=2011161 RepID=A0A914WQL9_9BILA
MLFFAERHSNRTAEYEEVAAFATEYFSILANSTTKLDVKLDDLRNSRFKSALNEILPDHLDEQLNLAKLKIYVDENLIDNLDELFQRKPKQGQHFTLLVALMLMSHSIDVRPYGKEEMSQAQLSKFCFYEAVNPVKVGAIFNLYVANLMIRNSFSLTTESELLTIKGTMKKVQNEISEALGSASWSRSGVEILSNIIEFIGLPEEVFVEDNYAAELSRFSGFEAESDIFGKIMKLRASNFRLAERHLSARDSYFKLIATFHAGLNHLTLPIMFFQPPYYRSDYPTSYIFGFLGSTFGHEIMHRFAPPHNQANWFSHASYNQSLNCYKRSYNDMCFVLTAPHDQGASENREETECVDGENDLKDNIPDVEGARAAFKAMKRQLGEEKLGQQAIEELDGVTNEQLFFIANAKVYCDKKMNDQAEFLKSLRNSEDSHGAEKVRVNGIARQMSEFATAFHCQPTQAMVLSDSKRCFLFN